MAKIDWKKVRGRVELVLWVGVLAFAVYRFGPQVGAALGIGASHEAVRGGSIRTLDGTVFSMEDLRGRVVLVSTWATWCPPCVIEMPGFQKVFEDYRDEGFLAIGVSRDQDDPAQVTAYLSEKGITYPVAMASDVDWDLIAQVGVLPTSFLLGRDGTIRHRVEGFFAEPTLRMAVKRLLNEESRESGG